MGGLECAIAALDVLGSVVQAVPVIGENLKAATEVAMKICELVKVRMQFATPYVRSMSRAEDEGES
jgi:hypothetical protein